MNTMKVWVKWRERWASGPSNWQWSFTSTPLEDFKYDVDQSNDWSEMYRGCDAELADAPLPVVRAEIARLDVIYTSAVRDQMVLIEQAIALESIKSDQNKCT